MGNSNIPTTQTAQGELEVYKYSSFYGRHELKDGRIIKKYRLSNHQNQSFVKLIQSYQDIGHPSLIPIEDVHFVSFENQTHHYEVTFPYHSQTLGCVRSDQHEYLSQKEALRVIRDVGEGIRIFNTKNFPHEDLSPQKIAIREDLGYCIGVDILMNPEKTFDKKRFISQQFSSPEARNLWQFEQGYDRTRSAIYSLGLVILKSMGKELNEPIDQTVFQMRKQYSFEFCNLIEAMLHPENRQRISLDDCLENCRDIIDLEGLGAISPGQTFIRGYNCVDSLWFFEEENSPALQDKWNEKCKRKALL